MNILYTSIRIIDGKPRKVIVDEYGKIVNRNPSIEELKGLEKCPEKDGRSKSRPHQKYSDDFLLNCLRQFSKENGRSPTQKDFTNHPEYPNFDIFYVRFGGFQKALKLVELDFESMIKKGVLKNNSHKGRFGEMIIRDHFENNPIDLAGENQNSPCDGICPNGKIYDVKTSKLYYKTCYIFGTNNKYKDKIDMYYFLAFNDEDYKTFDYGWRVPGEVVEKYDFKVGLGSSYRFNIESMKEYDITDKIRYIFEKYD